MTEYQDDLATKGKMRSLQKRENKGQFNKQLCLKDKREHPSILKNEI